MDRASGALDATAELASVEQCSEPERRPSGSIVYATTLLASVERCSWPRAAVARATPPDARYETPLHPDELGRTSRAVAGRKDEAATIWC
jgi:hypothetical protein